MGTIQNTAALYLRKSSMDDQLFVSGHTITAWARHRTRPRRPRDSDPDSPSCSSVPSPLSGSSGISTPWVGLPWHSSSSSLRWNTPALRRRPRPLSDVRRGTRCGRDPLWATPQDLTRRPWLDYSGRYRVDCGLGSWVLCPALGGAPPMTSTPRVLSPRGSLRGRGHSKRYGLWPPPRQRPEPDGVVFPRVQTSQCTEAGERVAATLVSPSCGQSTLPRPAIALPS